MTAPAFMAAMKPDELRAHLSHHAMPGSAYFADLLHEAERRFVDADNWREWCENARSALYEEQRESAALRAQLAERPVIATTEIDALLDACDDVQDFLDGCGLDAEDSRLRERLRAAVAAARTVPNELRSPSSCGAVTRQADEGTPAHPPFGAAPRQAALPAAPGGQQ